VTETVSFFLYRWKNGGVFSYDILGRSHPCVFFVLVSRFFDDFEVFWFFVSGQTGGVAGLIV